MSIPLDRSFHRRQPLLQAFKLVRDDFLVVRVKVEVQRKSRKEHTVASVLSDPNAVGKPGWEAQGSGSSS